MFLAVSFVHKQFITVLDCLHGGNTQVILLSLWDGIYEISPDMGSATTAPDIFQVVITLISICFQVSAAVSFQESFDMVFCPGLRVSEKDDRRETVFPGSYQPHTGLRLCAPLRFFRTWTLVSSAIRKPLFRSSRWKDPYTWIKYRSTQFMIQFAIVVLESSTPNWSQSFSCRYRGSERLYF